MKNKILISAVLVFVLAMSAAPAFAFVGPPYVGNVPTEDGKFEVFGPRVDTLYISMYADTESEWNALTAGDIDITDWPLTTARLRQFLDSVNYPYIGVADAGGEFGSYYLDLNNAEFTNDNDNDIIGDQGDLRNPLGDPTEIVLPPDHPYLPGATVTRGSQFRLAIAHLVDRDTIITMSDGATPIHYPMYTHLPEETTFRERGWINDNVYKYPCSRQLAATILDMAGYVDTDGDGWRNYDSNGDGVIDATDANINLQFYTRLDSFRTAIGDFVQAGLVALGVQVTRHSVTGGGAWNDCMLIKKHHMYTAGWVLSRMPTLLYGLFHTQFYWHPGDPPNYNKVSDPILDDILEDLYTPVSLEEAYEAGFAAQYRMLQPDCVFNIPVGNNHMYKAYKKYYATGTGTGPYWLGILNTEGSGINTGALPLDSFLSAHPENAATGGIIKYGWQQNWVPSSLNPFQYSWYWDAEVIFRVYEGCLMVNPYDAFGGGPMGMPGDLPWLANFWNQEVNEAAGTTKVTFYLRDDVYFHDGTKMTAKDYYYTVQLGHWMAHDHPEYGWTALPPWFWESISDITPEYAAGDTPGVGVDMPDGPNGYKIVVNYNVASVWALWYAGGIPIVPKHKWWDVFYPDPTGVDGFAPDPQMIGTGPFKFYPHKCDGTDEEYHKLGDHIKMDKFTNYHHSYEASVQYSVTYGSYFPYIYISGPDSTVKVLAETPYGNRYIDNIKVKGGWGLTEIPGLPLGSTNCFITVILPHGSVSLWATLTQGGNSTLPGDLTGGMTPPLPPPDSIVDYKDLFVFLKGYGQKVIGWTSPPS